MAERLIGPGTLLAGRFRLEDLLDESEGGKFWRATDRVLARNVAVHVIAASNPRAQALLDAARTSATVTDGHLLRVLDADAEDDVVYVVNEWGTGMSMDRLLDEAPLSPRRAAWLVKEVAEAICTAHRGGVAHGRLLPENVLVTEAGSVKLIGFVVDAALRGGYSPGSTEALHDDVRNLGALLYAGLTGRWPGSPGSAVPPAPPAPAGDAQPLRPRQVRAGVPRGLDAICDRLLSTPAQMTTALEVFAALSDYIGDPTGSAYLGDATVAVETGTHPGLEDATQPVARPKADPEATQAGTPVFDAPVVGTDYSEPHSDLRPRQTPPPPPPVLPEPEPRPLFASEPRAGRTAAASPAAPSRSPGPPSGPLPAVWGPDAHSDDDTGDLAPGGYDTGSWKDAGPGKSWLKLAAVIAALAAVVVAAVVAFNLGRDGDPAADPDGSVSSSRDASATPEPLEVAGATAFDPEGDGEENGEDAALAVDGQPGTAWNTQTYYDSADLNGLKSGVGLVIDLGTAQELSAVELRLVGTPTSAQILAAPDASSPPTSTDGLEQVASVNGAGANPTLELEAPVTTQYFVLWLTSLPQVSDGFRAEVAEIVPLS